MEVNIHQAKTHLSKLLERAALGEEIIIAKAGNAGRPVWSPIKRRQGKRPLGLAKGQIVVPDDFDAPLPAEIEEDFYR